jgi:hypothetical protein
MNGQNWTAKFERKLEDLWIGAFWKRDGLNLTTHLWVCIIPCFPLHVTWWKFRCPRCEAIVSRLGKDSLGNEFCCVHCAFSPDGCRCRFGEFGKAESERCWTAPDLTYD